MAGFDERDLIRRCQEGQESAFRELVDKYKHLVFGLIARMTSNRQEAEDLAQEVFLRVHRGLPYFRGEARLSTWIYRIVAHLCLQERQRGGPVAWSLDDPEHGTSVGEPGVVDARFSDLELRDRLEKAMAQLPAQYRLVLAAHYLQGVQYEDLAEALGLPLGTLKTQLHRAKRRLRQLLVQEPGAPG
jgi:RNA polymerase sigma-70 factor, ECF subfamily